MRQNRLFTSLISLAGAYFVGVPAKAAQLQSWQFDASQNRLTFTTGGGVQPRAKLLSNPNRLVVELPGVLFEQLPTNQVGGGGVREVRVEQSDFQMTRMILELNPDYQVTPQQIQVWGITSQEWVIQLPEETAEPGANAFSPFPPALRPGKGPGSPPVPPPGAATVQLPNFVGTKGEASPPPEPLELSQASVTAAMAPVPPAQLQSILTTPNGFFIQTLGAVPQVQIYRVRDRNQARHLVVDVVNAQITADLAFQTLPNAQYGVRDWSVAQFNTFPPAVRITLTLEDSSPDWQVTPIREGGIVLLPIGALPPAVPPTLPPALQQPPVPSAIGEPRSVSLPPIGSPPPQGQPASLPPPSAQPGPSPRSVPRSSPVVVLDPGHGGADPGAVGIGGLQEKQVVMAVTRHVAAILQAQGITVVLTRQGDEEVDLQPRVDIAEQANATVFVSIHANAISMDRPEVNGVETYYYSEMGERLATVLHNRVMGVMDMTDRGIRQARFYVLRRTSMPAVLIETGFVTGAIDAPKLWDPNWQARMGQAIAEGILEYLRP